MRNVEPYGRIFESDRPFTIAPIACSRTPKCMLRPPTLVALRPPASFALRSVLVDGARSAEPPISHGVFVASTLSTVPDESRDAIPFLSAGNTGRSASHP